MMKFFTLILFAVAATLANPTLAAEEPAALRIALTATVPHDQYQLIEEWRRYMERKLKRRVEFIRRDSYIETMDLLRQRKLDFAWICDYPFVYFRSQVKLLAVPLYQGRPYYRSYLIVPASNQSTTSISQLSNKVFAYTDPYSNTGYLAPRYQLQQTGENPAQFFHQTFFTWSHRKAVEAVAIGLADGAAVSSHVWDTLAIVKPELTAATRIVSRSPEYGFSPLVAQPSVRDEDFRNMQKLLLEMATDAEGKALLRGLNIDGFTKGSPHLYDEVARMMKTVGEK
jgi:phosphonate transport system substrate-binding protein